jgi:hypothetical protein
MNWADFKREAPELAAFGEERFDPTGLILPDTLRKSGWPRITPVEPLIAFGDLWLRMMWQSRKALDLLRDSRCTVHSTVSNRDGTEGEFKLYGRAIETRDLDTRRRYGEALLEKIGWEPEEPEVHLFHIDIESAASVLIQNEEMAHMVWDTKNSTAS